MGFANIQEWAAAYDAGRGHTTTFRKQVSSAATLANDFIDYTYFSGNPVANFYASAPLVAATLESNKGFYIPPVENQFLKCINVMSAAAQQNTNTNQRQRLHLLDYLLYYPFVDTDAVGELQEMDNAVTLPRETSGHGVQIIAVGQSASSTVGQFTVNYTNSDGVAGRVSQNTFTKVIAGGGVLVSSTNNAVTGSQLFLELQAGDKGVRSIESVTFTAGGGGLLALVLVRPVLAFFSTQECRRTTSGNLESYGAASEFNSIINTPAKNISGAVLGIVGLGTAGSLASSILVGTLETVWSA
jgi:hypothetical protein